MHSMMFHQCMGIDEPDIESWTSNLLQMSPVSPFSSYNAINMDLSIASSSTRGLVNTTEVNTTAVTPYSAATSTAAGPYSAAAADIHPSPAGLYNGGNIHSPGVDLYNGTDINSATDLIGHSAATMLNEGLDSLSDFSDEFVGNVGNCGMSPGTVCGQNTPPPSVDYDFPQDLSMMNGDVKPVIDLQFEKASRKTNPHQLPHCKVCNAQATGFHYGVNSCEACKGFFHRSLLRKKPYKCYKSAKCEIKPGKRNVCGQCRYKRCLDVGMSKEGIKTGRYTYEKRTKDIMEIKKDHLEKAEAIEKELECDRKTKLESFIHRLVVAKERFLSDIEVVQQIKGGVTAIHKEAPDKLMYIPYEPPEPFEEGTNLWRKWASVVENTGGVRRVIKFVKTIPGFRDLDMSDQIQLIKHSFCEIWLISRHKFFDTEKKVYHNKVGFLFDVVKAIGEEDSSTFLNVAKRLKLLDLTDEEAALMVAFVIFFSDRCALIKAQQVDKIQETILEALTYVLHRKYADDKTRFGKIMSVFIELRSMTELYHLLSDRALSNIGDIAPLLWEIINLS